MYLYCCSQYSTKSKLKVQANNVPTKFQNEGFQFRVMIVDKYQFMIQFCYANLAENP